MQESEKNYNNTLYSRFITMRITAIEYCKLIVIVDEWEKSCEKIILILHVAKMPKIMIFSKFSKEVYPSLTGPSKLNLHTNTRHHHFFNQSSS